MKRLFNALLALALIVSFVIPVNTPSVSAATYRTAYNSAASTYKTSKYYENYTKVELTGDQRTDIVAIALSQAGYLESNNGSYSGLVAGSGNYTEYNYNMGDWGAGYAYEWCASFVAWALYQARCTDQNRISDWCRNYKYTNSAYIWREVGCAHWADQLRYYGHFKYSKANGGTYAPQPGDLIFFAWDGGKSGEDHIGLVVYSDSNYVYTIEGNTSDAQGLVAAGGGVFFKKYALSYVCITGYGCMPYKTNSSVAKIDYSGANPTTGYYVNVHGSKALYSTETGTTSLVSVPRFTMFEVTGICSNGRVKANVTVNGTSYTGYMLNDSSRIVQFTNSGNNVKSPSITASSAVNYGQAIGVSWDADENATSYNYKVELYNGEMSATTATTILSSTTTGTSFTIPAQSKGKYLKISVTAVGPDNSATGTKTVMLGGNAAYPADMEYIPVADLNGSTAVSNSTIWTAAKGSTFSAVYWDAFLCSPNADGTYTVNNAYPSGSSKSVTVSGTNVLFAIHSAYENYSYASAIKAGDKLSFVGVFIDNNTISGKGYVLVNGGIPLVSDLTAKDDSITKCGDGELIRGFDVNSSAATVCAKFNEDSKYIVIKNASGQTLESTAYVGTGCSIELVVGDTVKKSYKIVVAGDINGDASVSTADYIVQARVAKSLASVDGAYENALDVNGDGSFSSADLISLSAKIAGR